MIADDQICVRIVPRVGFAVRADVPVTESRCGSIDQDDVTGGTVHELTVLDAEPTPHPNRPLRERAAKMAPDTSTPPSRRVVDFL